MESGTPGVVTTVGRTDDFLMRIKEIENILESNQGECSIDREM